MLGLLFVEFVLGVFDRLLEDGEVGSGDAVGLDLRVQFHLQGFQETLELPSFGQELGLVLLVELVDCVVMVILHSPSVVLELALLSFHSLLIVFIELLFLSVQEFLVLLPEFLEFGLVLGLEIFQLLVVFVVQLSHAVLELFLFFTEFLLPFAAFVFGV